MLRTKCDLVIPFGPGQSVAHVPKGTPIRRLSREAGSRESWLVVDRPHDFMKPKSFEWHDAIYYWINVPSDQVEEVED